MFRASVRLGMKGFRDQKLQNHVSFYGQDEAWELRRGLSVTRGVFS